MEKLDPTHLCTVPAMRLLLWWASSFHYEIMQSLFLRLIFSSLSPFHSWKYLFHEIWKAVKYGVSFNHGTSAVGGGGSSEEVAESGRNIADSHWYNHPRQLHPYTLHSHAGSISLQCFCRYNRLTRIRSKFSVTLVHFISNGLSLTGTAWTFDATGQTSFRCHIFVANK